MNAEIARTIVTSAHAEIDATLEGLYAQGAHISHVVSLADIGHPVPYVDVWALGRGIDVEHIVIRCSDISMPEDAWVVRYGGSRDELFQSEDVAPLIAVGKHLLSTAGTETVVVHCAAGVSRSTAATIVILAAAGFGPDDAVEGAWEAQQASFRWREPRDFLPNTRILDIASEQMYGDHRLTAAYERWRLPV